MKSADEESVINDTLLYTADAHLMFLFSSVIYKYKFDEQNYMAAQFI